MEWCVSFPRETILVARPSLRKACGGNRNAAKFLSYLLYLASIQKQEDKSAPVTINRTQPQIIKEMDEEISDRTLRDEAIHCLTELRYITCEEVKGNKQFTAYTIYPESIQRGISFPESIKHYKSMKYYLDKADRKNFRAEIFPDGGENIPDRPEKTPNPKLEPTGKISGLESATESSSEADLANVSEDPKSNREIYERENKREDPSIHSSIPSLNSSQKPDMTGYLRMFMRKFLLEMGATGKLMDDHLKYLQQLYYASGLDKETFRSQAEVDLGKTRQVDSDLGYFYELFHKSLGVPMAPKSR